MTDTPIIAYKGFNKDLKCRNFQYEIGKEYNHGGKVQVCNSGFHVCKEPLDILSYYNICDSRFTEVEISGEIKDHPEDSKLAVSHIRIKAELTVGQFIKASVDCVFNGWFKKTMAEKEDGDLIQASSGDNAQQASSGNYAQQASSGYNAQQASSGDYAQQASSGNYAQQASSGYNAQQASSGNYAKQASSGYNAKQEITGDFGVLSSVHAKGKFKGKKGTLVSLVLFKDDEITPVKFVTGEIGKKGLKENVWYELDAKGEFVEIA